MAEFEKAWADAGDWDELIVVEDAPQRTPGFTNSPRHFSWHEIDEILGEDAWIISRQDSAIRCFGFLMAVRLGADYILTLDDDVRPATHQDANKFAICRGHRIALAGHSRWCATVPDLHPRGLPYRNTGSLAPVVLSVGLWRGCPDQDSLGMLTAPRASYMPPAGTWVVPHGQYYCMCGMNLMFRQEILPLMYFPLMGKGSPYRRMDDIWCGIICKKVLDHLGWHVSVGEPHVQHLRASDPFTNLIAEAPGIARNETLWAEIDACRLAGSEPVGCVRELGTQLESIGSDEYLRTVGRALQVWVGLGGNPTAGCK